MRCLAPFQFLMLALAIFVPKGFRAGSALRPQQFRFGLDRTGDGDGQKQNTHGRNRAKSDHGCAPKVNEFWTRAVPLLASKQWHTRTAHCTPRRAAAQRRGLDFAGGHEVNHTHAARLSAARFESRGAC